jgi:23S rRNA (uridine2552-2'-O)-methyltransferase
MSRTPGRGPGSGRPAGGGRGGSGGDAGGAGRGLEVRVRTARKRSHASTLWLARQLNDPYVAAAKRDGFRSRAAYKLLEIDAKKRLLKPNQRIVDLGAAPGGWSQISAERSGSAQGRGKVVAIDLLDVEPIAGVDFMRLDFLADAAPDLLKERLGGQADLVLSDMAANTTGHRKTDHLRIVALVDAAAAFAREVLAPGGAFLAKVFQGGAEGELLALLKRDFAKVEHVKPPASRKGSSELYVLATGFRGGDAKDREME